MKQFIKSLSYILLISLFTWFSVGFADFFTGGARFFAAEQAPGDFTAEEERSSFIMYLYTFSVMQIVFFLLFRFLGSSRIHPIIQYGTPILALLVFAFFIYQITIGYSI